MPAITDRQVGVSRAPMGDFAEVVTPGSPVFLLVMKLGPHKVSHGLHSQEQSQLSASVIVAEEQLE